MTAWSEIAAMSSALAIFVVLRFVIFKTPEAFSSNSLFVLLVTTGAVTVIWLAVALLTKPASMDHLKAFYIRVRPGGPLWGPVVRELRSEGNDVEGDSLLWPTIGWISATVMVYAAIFAVGKLCLQEFGAGVIALVVCAVMAPVTNRAIREMTG